jgi:MFS family permease
VKSSLSGLGSHPAYPALRAFSALILLTFGGAGMYLAIIVLKPVEAEFEVERYAASLPYTVHMIGFGLGGILMGWVSDRVGVAATALLGSVMMALGYSMASQATSIHELWLIHAIFIGLLGSATVFGPLVADISHWFTARRGMAVAVVISGSYVAGALWPPILQHGFETVGWRETYQLLAVATAAVMIPLSLMLLPRRVTTGDASLEEDRAAFSERPLGLSRTGLQSTICVAGIGCCAAMAVPQVHIVAHATDLGFEAVDGAGMLAVMLGCGIISRLGSGWISDKIGGLRTLLLGSVFQGVMIAAFIPTTSLEGLYVVSGLFGLSQGGIVPSYAMIVRSCFPAAEAGWRIGLSLLFTILGMALGGFLAGYIFTRTGSYDMAFIMALAFNMGNIIIAVTLLMRSRGTVATATA